MDRDSEMASTSKKRRSSEKQSEEEGAKKRMKTDKKKNMLHSKSVMLISPDKTSCLLFLQAGQVVSILGKAEVQVLFGSVDVLGHRLTASTGSQHVFSPSFLSLITMAEASRNTLEHSDEELEEITKALDGGGKDLKKALNRAKKSSTVVLMRTLQTLETSYVTSFKEYKNIFTLKSQEKEEEEEEEKEIEEIHIKTSSLGFWLFDPDQESHKTFHAPDRWKQISEDVEACIANALNKGASFPVILNCGGKDVGKSSFGRYLLNMLLNSCQSVFFLECDVGQSEFTPPTFVSLNEIKQPVFGPPFTHLQKPVKTHFFGDVSPKDNPSHYVRCILDLYQSYKTTHSSKGPLIVNTQGWVKGLGLLLLFDVIRGVDPSHIIQMNSSTSTTKNLDPLTHEEIQSAEGWMRTNPVNNNTNERVDGSPSEETKPVIYQTESFHSSQNPAYRSLSLKSHEIRTLSVLAYFSHLQEDFSGEDTNWTPKALHLVHPYKVPWKCVAAYVVHVKVDRSQILFSLNASVVCLAVADQDQVKFDHSQSADGLGRLVDTQSHPQCLGLGVVRNIDVEKKRLYILTPVEYEDLKKVNLLMKGNLEIPLMLLSEGKMPKQPYLTSEFSYGIRGSGAQKVRLNLQRRKYDSPNTYSAAASTP